VTEFGVEGPIKTHRVGATVLCVQREVVFAEQSVSFETFKMALENDSGGARCEVNRICVRYAREPRSVKKSKIWTYSCNDLRKPTLADRQRQPLIPMVNDKLAKKQFQYDGDFDTHSKLNWDMANGVREYSPIAKRTCWLYSVV